MAFPHKSFTQATLQRAARLQRMSYLRPASINHCVPEHISLHGSGYMS